MLGTPKRARPFGGRAKCSLGGAMLQDIAPASVGRWRAAGGSFTARAFAVNLGDEQADIHYEHKVLSSAIFLLMARLNNSSAHSRVDKSTSTSCFFMRPSTRQNEGHCRMTPAAKMRDDKPLKNRQSVSDTALTTNEANRPDDLFLQLSFFYPPFRTIVKSIVSMAHIQTINGGSRSKVSILKWS